MHKKPMTLIITLLTVFVLFTPVRAQEGDGYKETFDDPALPHWEHSPETIVTDGMLKINPGSFALRFGVGLTSP